MPTYKDNIPQPSDIISTSQDDILQNFESIPNVIDPNQYSVIMPVASAPDIADAKQVGLYAKLDSNSAVNEIWFKRGISDAGVDGVPITGGVASITGPVPTFVTSTSGTPDNISCGWNRISNGAWQKYCAFSVGTASVTDTFTVDLSLIGPAYATLLGFKASVTEIPNGNYTILSATNLIITLKFTSTASTLWTMYIATTGM